MAEKREIWETLRGARGEGRTPMVSPPADFESAASAISPPGLRQVATPFLARAFRGVKVSRCACAFPFPSKAMLESRRRDPGMAQVQCVRCGNQGEAITEPLFLGKLETQVKANISAPCWAEWVKMRVMVINEYHVNLGDESGRALVREQMLNFLKLPKPEQQPQ